jgi:hypothetical protein
MPPQNQPPENQPPQTRIYTVPQQDRLQEPVGFTSPPPPPPPVARRSILRGIAGIGAVGVAAAAGAGAVIKLDKPAAATLKPAAKPVAMAPMAPSAMAGPLVVYIADTTAGVLDVYAGTGATQIRNPALVSQLLADLKLA